MVTARPEKGASAAAKPAAEAKPYPQPRNAQSRPVDPAFAGPIGTLSATATKEYDPDDTWAEVGD